MGVGVAYGSQLRNKEDSKRNEKNIFNLKTKKKYLANFNYLYDILIY
jgi:hypothetical protein